MKYEHVPKVTIGLLIYNGEKFIKLAIDSLLSQTFSDFELIISDNASIDSTQYICTEYAKNDKRIIYYRQDQNIGLENNYIFLVSKAKGEFFMWASYDDIWDKNFISNLLHEFKNPDVVSVFCPSNEIDEDNNRLRVNLKYNYEGKKVYERIFKYWLDGELSRDVIMYGLHRTEILNGLKLKTFRWPNNDRPDGVGDMISTFILASGIYRFVECEPGFIRRITLNPPRKENHKKRTFISELFHAFFLDLQMSFRALRIIINCSHSYLASIVCTPILITYIIKANFQRILQPFVFKIKRVYNSL
jgi:glycosyltransferase involved in cell wall biosynthesis